MTVEVRAPYSAPPSATSDSSPAGPLLRHLAAAPRDEPEPEHKEAHSDDDRQSLKRGGGSHEGYVPDQEHHQCHEDQEGADGLCCPFRCPLGFHRHPEGRPSSESRP